MRRYPYTDEALVEEHTRYWTDRDARCLQAHVGGNELVHCAWLLYNLDPVRDAHVLDIGSGVGGVAQNMAKLRSDLEFTLLNVSPFQLAMSPVGRRVCGDMEALPFADGSFDAALICYALGHADAPRALTEARRVAKRVLVFDILADDDAAWLRVLHYRLPSREELAPFGKVTEFPHADGGRFESLLPGFWKSTGAREFLMTVH